MLNAEACEWQQFKTHCLGKLRELFCIRKTNADSLIPACRTEEFKMFSWEGGTASSKYWLLMEQKVEPGLNSFYVVFCLFFARIVSMHTTPRTVLLLHIHLHKKDALVSWWNVLHDAALLRAISTYSFAWDRWRKNSPVICFIVVQVSFAHLCNLFASL